MNNNDRIQEIRDRQKSATPGDWFVNPGEHFYSIISAQRKGRMQVIASEIAANDAMIIGHATSDVAYLLSEYDRLQSQNETLKEALQEVIKVGKEDKEKSDDWAQKVTEEARKHLSNVNTMKEALEWTHKRFEEEWTYEPGIGEVVDEIIGRFTQ